MNHFVGKLINSQDAAGVEQKKKKIWLRLGVGNYLLWTVLKKFLKYFDLLLSWFQLLKQKTNKKNQQQYNQKS